jgi:putative peptidoglycan lipid II flippase
MDHSNDDHAPEPSEAPAPTEEAPAQEAPAKAATGEGESIARNTTIVGGFLLLGRFGGMFREVIVSRVIGTSAAADAFRFANETVLQDLFTKFEKLLQPVYMPIFVARQRKDGDAEAFRFTRVVGTIQLILLLAMAVLGSLFAPEIVRRIATHEGIQPGTEGFALAVVFLRMFFPALVVFSLSNLVELTIQSYKHFTIPALAEAVRRLLLVVAVVLAVAYYHKPTAQQATMALAWGAVAGCLARMLIQLPKVWQYRAHFKPSLDFSLPDVKKGGRLAGPLIIGIVLSYARNVYEAKLALKLGEGFFSALKYARKLVDMPWQILSLALSYVIYPFISELGAKQDNESMADALVRMARVMVFVFAPITALCWVLSEPTVRVVYYGGHFDEDSVRLTNSALPFYVIGLVFFAIEDPLLKRFYAMSDTATPIALGVMADLVWFGAVVLGVLELQLGLPALAAAFSIQKVVKVIVVLIVLRAKLGGIPLTGVGTFLGKVIAACAVMAFLVHVAAGALGPSIPFDPKGVAHNGALLVAMMVVSAVAFLGMCHALKVEELALVVGRLRKKLGR